MFTTRVVRVVVSRLTDAFEWSVIRPWTVVWSSWVCVGSSRMKPLCWADANVVDFVPRSLSSRRAHPSSVVFVNSYSPVASVVCSTSSLVVQRLGGFRGSLGHAASHILSPRARSRRHHAALALRLGIGLVLVHGRGVRLTAVGGLRFGDRALRSVLVGALLGNRAIRDSAFLVRVTVGRDKIAVRSYEYDPTFSSPTPVTARLPLPFDELFPDASPLYVTRVRATPPSSSVNTSVGVTLFT